MKKTMKYDANKKTWTALNHFLFIGWDILEVGLTETIGILSVQVRRRFCAADWPPPSMREKRIIHSIGEYIPDKVTYYNHAQRTNKSGGSHA